MKLDMDLLLEVQRADEIPSPCLNVDWPGAEPTCGSARVPYICGAQEAHQPAALTSLPGKIWHGPCVEPSAPW